MHDIILYTLGSVLLVSLLSFIGVLSFSFKEKTLKEIIIFMVSFAAGALLGDAFIHLLPESVAAVGFTVKLSLYLLSGVVFFFILEKIIHWRHCHIPTSKRHPHPFALVNLFGDSLHNFIDGVIIAASYLISIPVGIATTLAVILHEIPQEIGDFGILLHGGFSKGKALLFNFLTALTAVVGAGLALLLVNLVEGATPFLVTFAAGGFIYIAGADLIPELHKDVEIRKSLLQLFFILLGIGIMLLLLWM